MNEAQSEQAPHPDKPTVRALPLAVIALVAILFFGPAWMQPEGLWYPSAEAEFSDLTVTHWPKMRFLQQSLRTWGQFPLWQSQITGGGPAAGNPLWALFYPLTWLFALLPTTLTFHLLLAAHMGIAGAAMYGLAHYSYRTSPLAALAAGIGYMLTPKLIAHLGAGHVGLFQAIAWLPLTLWALRSALDRCSALYAAGCGAALALVVLNDPRVAFYNSALLALYASYRLLVRWRREGMREAASLAARLAAVPLATALFAAAQIVPTAEMMGTITRTSLTLQEAAKDSLPPGYLLGYLIADRGGYHEWVTYLGLLPLAASALALWRSRERDRWFWAALIACCLLYALGTYGPLYPHLYRLMPWLGWVRVPSRALLLTLPAASLLLALGVDALLYAPWPAGVRKKLLLGAFGAGIGCAALGLGIAAAFGEEAPPAAPAFGLFGAATCTGLAIARSRLPRWSVGGGLILLLIADLWTVGRTLAVLQPAGAVFDQGRAQAEYLSAQPGLFRTYSPSYSIPHQTASLVGLEQLDGVEPAQIRWTAQWMSRAGGYTVHGYAVTFPALAEGENIHTARQDAIPDAAALGLLNACYVVADYPIEAPGLELRTRQAGSYVYHNVRCLPRVYLTLRVQRAAGWEDAQAQAGAAMDPGALAWVEDGPTLDGPAGWQPVHEPEITPNRIAVQADTAQPALLVLSEIWYPGWEVTVDGEPRPLYRVDGLVRGVYLEPGAHRVVWRYRPASVRWGVGISALAVLGGTVAAGRRHWARRKRVGE
jgi:hypothetical protein